MRYPFSSKSFVLIVPLLLVVPRSAGIAQEDVLDEQGLETIRAVVQGARQNLASFSQVYCRFEVVKGRAGNRAAVLDGDFDVESAAVVIWVKDGKKVRCTMETSREELSDSLKRQFREGATTATSWFRIHTFLGDGTNQLSGGGNSATLYGPGNHLRNKDHENLWQVQLYPKRIEAALESDDAGSVHIAGIGENGKITIEFKRSKESSRAKEGQTCRITFDTRRGYLPVEVRHVYDGADDGIVSAHEVHVSEARRCSNGRWFPVEVIDMITQSNMEEVHVWRARVLELEVDRPPDPEEFKIVLDKGALVNERSAPQTQFKLQNSMRVGPDDLPGLVDRAMATLQRRAAGEQKLPTAAQAETPWMRWLIIASALAVGLVTVVVLYQRRRAGRVEDVEG